MSADSERAAKLHELASACATLASGLRASLDRYLDVPMTVADMGVVSNARRKLEELVSLGDVGNLVEAAVERLERAESENAAEVQP